MIFNVANKTEAEIDAIIEMFATEEQAKIMGFRFLLPVLDGDVLELVGGGYVIEEEPAKVSTLGQALWGKSEQEISHLNSFNA